MPQSWHLIRIREENIVEKPVLVIMAAGMGSRYGGLKQIDKIDSNGHIIMDYSIFDAKEALVGQMVRNVPIRHISTLDEFCRENMPQAAILCIPKEASKEICDQLVKLGVKGFLNFSHYDIALDHPGVEVENIHFGDSLMTLSYKLSN